MEKYFYFRKDATAANDDDQVAGSNVVRVSDLLSMESTSNTTMTLKFKGRNNILSGGEGANVDYTADTLVLTHAANVQKTIMDRILSAIAAPVIAGAPNTIVIFDGQLGGGITGVTDVDSVAQAAQA